MRHKIWSIILVLILIAIIASAAAGGNKSNKSNTTNSNNSAKTASKSALAKIGEPARDGKFEFTVKSIKCDQPSVVSPQSNLVVEHAQGQYCLVALTVKNIGDQQQSFFSNNQKLLDASGTQYSSADVATATINPNNIWAQINPGNNVEGTIVFDLPKGTTPTTAEFHDSAYSNGVKVSLQ